MLHTHGPSNKAYCEVLIIDDRGFIYGFILLEGPVRVGSKIP